MPMFDNAHGLTINNGLFVDNSRFFTGSEPSDTGQALIMTPKPEL
jgi:hypothetical protein